MDEAAKVAQSSMDFRLVVNKELENIGYQFMQKLHESCTDHTKVVRNSFNPSSKVENNRQLYVKTGYLAPIGPLLSKLMLISNCAFPLFCKEQEKQERCKFIYIQGNKLKLEWTSLKKEALNGKN